VHYQRDPVQTTKTALSERSTFARAREAAQTRSFCVGDLIRAFLEMMDRLDLQGPVDIASPIGFATRERAEKAIAKKSRLVTHPLPHDYPLKRRPSISHTCERLGWKA
jgi:hypothetical protein